MSIDHAARMQEALAAELRSTRAVQRLSRVTLAKMTGIHDRTLARLESGERSPSVDQLARIAFAFGEGMSELVERAEQRLR